MPASAKWISGVVLAAGEARRLGQTKQLLAFRGTTLVGAVLEQARRSRLDELVLVLGHDAQRIREAVDLEGLKVVVNGGYRLGQSTSLKAGLAQVSPQADAAMFLLGDQPLVDGGLIDTLIAAFETGTHPIVIPCSGGQRGNPVIIGRELFGELAETASGDAGARVLFERHASSLRFVELGSRGIHVDVDTPEDYRHLLALDQA